MTEETLEIPGYDVHGRLGEGGMATVWLATQESLQRKVAIKVLQNTEEDLAERFIKEARFLASINHPRVLTVYNIARLADGKPYIAMEFLSGGDLKQRMPDGIEPLEALQIVRDIAEGLAVVHDKGILHRDIKPANILFRDNGVAVLTDFGVARPLTQDSDLTQAGLTVGSPAYSSPEQTQCKPLDQRSDIYSLGVVLLELLLQQNPFRADSPTQTAINHIQKPLPELPPALGKFRPLLNRMLAKEPKQRFSDCHELLLALNDIQQQIVSKTAVPASDETAITAVTPGGITLASRYRYWYWLLPLVLLVAAGIYTQWPSEQLSTEKVATEKPAIERPAQPREAGSLARPVHEPEIVAEPEPEPDPYHEQLQLGWQRIQEGQFVEPDEDNATWYFEQVLAADPGNEHALAGLVAVRNKRVNRYLELAGERISERRLMVPAEDNAVFYFQRALTLSPRHPEAQAGLQQVSREYLRLGKVALEQRELDTAAVYVDRGLLVSPGDRELLALKAEIEEQSRPRLQRFFDRFR